MLVFSVKENLFKLKRINDEVIKSEIRIQFSSKTVVVLRCEKGKRENIINIDKRLKIVRVKKLIKWYIIVLKIVKMKFYLKDSQVSLKFNIIL
jgi:hypothetical protein